MEIKQKSIIVFLACLLLIVICIMVVLFFFKGPILTKQQAIYLAYQYLHKLEGYNFNYEEFLEHKFKAFKDSDETWIVINEQFYNPGGTGLMGGGLLFRFDKNRNWLKDELTQEKIFELYEKYGD